MARASGSGSSVGVIVSLTCLIHVSSSDFDQNITVDRLGAPTSDSNYLLAPLPVGGSSTKFYTVEARRFVGYDGRVPAEAVLIHKVDTTLADSNAPRRGSRRQRRP